MDFSKLTDNEIIEMFVDWVMLQPASNTYTYQSLNNCAVGQFILAVGADRRGKCCHMRTSRVYNVIHSERVHILSGGNPFSEDELAFGTLQRMMHKTPQLWNL